MTLHCRNCRIALESRLVHLAQMPLTDEFVPVNAARQEYLGDIDIYECTGCGLIQNPRDFDHEGYYEDYEYSSGHSPFVRRFMQDFACAVRDASIHASGHAPASVIEIGSGDGEQLKAFAALGVPRLLGVEPSAALFAHSTAKGIPALKKLFSLDTALGLGDVRFDVCLSSYTLDHVRDPVDYLRAAHHLLSDTGILAFEVHDLDKIFARSEWCLFEHEHTVYLDAAMAASLVSQHGFEVLSVNPIPESTVRANSLIVIARKSGETPLLRPTSRTDYRQLQRRIDRTISRIDAWLETVPGADRVVGYGAGGRGIMSLAALNQHERFATLFDSNYQSGKLLSPKTRIPISGPDRLGEFADSWCVVFSYGYLAEISELLLSQGFSAHRIVGLDRFYDEGAERT